MNSLAPMTALLLCSELEKRALPYCIMRNYEDFPSVRHDLDMAVRQCDGHAFRSVLAEIALAAGWDALIECDHWARSRVLEHNVEVFRFYKMAPLESFQVDVFHGAICLGLPVLGESELLSRCERSECGRFDRIHPDLENVIRLLQVFSLIDEPRSPKFLAYWQRLSTRLACSRDSFENACKHALGGASVEVLRAISRDDIGAYKRAMADAKAGLAAGRLIAAPVRTTLTLGARAAYVARTRLLRPCGERIRVDAPSVDAKQTVLNALERLRAAKMIPAWRVAASRRSAMPVLERGGIALAWRDGRTSDMQVSDTSSVDEIAMAVVRRQIARHRILYRTSRAAA